VHTLDLILNSKGSSSLRWKCCCNGQLCLISQDSGTQKVRLEMAMTCRAHLQNGALLISSIWKTVTLIVAIALLDKCSTLSRPTKSHKNMHSIHEIPLCDMMMMNLQNTQKKLVPCSCSTRFQ
jgi:hypothetical protein